MCMLTALTVFVESSVCVFDEFARGKNGLDDLVLLKNNEIVCTGNVGLQRCPLW